MGTRIRTFSVDLEPRTVFIMDCSVCGVVYGFDSAYEDRRRDDGVGWVCPNGHGQIFTRSEAKKQADANARLKADLEHMTASRDAFRDQADAAERSRRAVKGHLTRLRNRIANGVCPCCQRSFGNVRQHIAQKHPDWAASHVEAMHDE